MDSQDSIAKILRDIDVFISESENSNDLDARRLARKLKQIRRRVSPTGLVKNGIRLAWLIDKIFEYYDYLDR